MLSISLPQIHFPGRTGSCLTRWALAVRLSQWRFSPATTTVMVQSMAAPSSRLQTPPLHSPQTRTAYRRRRSMRISPYLTAAREGRLTAVAEEFARNHKLASYTVVITDEQETRIGLMLREQRKNVHRMDAMKNSSDLRLDNLLSPSRNRYPMPWRPTPCKATMSMRQG